MTHFGQQSKVEAICASAELRPQEALYMPALNPGIWPANKHRLVFWMTRHEAQAPLVTPAAPNQPPEAEMSDQLLITNMNGPG